MEQTLFLFGFILIGLSWLHLLPFEIWWIRVSDFPHLQLFFMLGMVGATYVLFFYVDTPSALIFTGAIALTLLYQAYRIRPYTRLHGYQVLPVDPPTQANVEFEGDTVKLLIANVYMENSLYAPLTELIHRHDPDAVLLVETNQVWMQALQSLEARYPHRVYYPLENTYGMLFYSRLEIASHAVHFLVKDDIPSLDIRLKLPSGRLIQFYGVHPRPPIPGESNESTERDVELIQIGKRAKRSALPVVVAGDLNDVAWSHTTRLFQRLSGLLDPRLGRGLYNTFHARYPLLRWPLDHVFVSHHFKLIALQRLSYCGSDHFPMLIHLSYAPDPESKENKPQAQPEDYSEARRKEEKEWKA